MPRGKRDWTGRGIPVVSDLLRAALDVAKDRGMSERGIARRMARSYFGRSATDHDVKSIANQIGYLATGKQKRCRERFLEQLARALDYPAALLSDVDGTFREQMDTGRTLWAREERAALPGRVEIAKYEFWRAVRPALERDFTSREERFDVAQLLDQLVDPAHWRFGLHLPQDSSRVSVSGAAPKAWRVSEAEEVAWAGLVNAMRQILEPWIQNVRVQVSRGGSQGARLHVRGLWLLYRALQAPDSLPKRHSYAKSGGAIRAARIKAAEAEGYTVVQSEEERTAARKAGAARIALFPRLPPGRASARGISWREWRDLE